MTAAVETMAYAGQVPWHGLGNKVSNKLTPKQMCKAAGIDWTVSKQPIQLAANSKGIDDHYALARDTDLQVFSIVGAKYKPTQNEVAMDFFKKFVEAGHMEMETAGALWDGRYVWGLARIGKDFKIGKNDEMRGYVLLASPHVLGKALVIMHTMVRVVCWNTFCQALGANLKGKAASFRMPHTLEFNEEVQKAAAETLGIATEQTTYFQEAATHLSKKKLTAQAADEYFFQVLKFDPAEAKKKKDGELIVPQMLPKLRVAMETGPGADLIGSAGTLWGAFNAVTYVIDHETGRKDRGTALKNAWLGNHANTKREAFEIALELAK